ncbi:Glutaredoxin-C6 protein [Spatholobus suberectus]|nr:Glutaredoxin-C6 protein [Spatholobus suberectus]
MEGIGCCSNDVVGQLEVSAITMSNSSSLSMDLDESTESRIQRLISEHPVIIFTRSSCCMCHVMKKLLATIGVHPTVIELDDHEIPALPLSDTTAPAAFIGGTCIGGLESLVALHVSGHLIPKLVEVGALWNLGESLNEPALAVYGSEATRVQEWHP